ncbi:MAG TPA: methyltransferase domain-containing protein [Thermodesulfobacteriota bacterium]
MSGPGGADAGREALMLRLFARSVLKQQKLREITALLGDTAGLDCLDLGSDNGVVSLLLRRRGGRWASADLDPAAVAAIRELVGDGVYQLDGPRLPFPDDRFDVVVVVDLLEHVEDDRTLVEELWRVTRPGGRLVVNVPHARETALRRLRLAIGQTDERHGHVRPGYTADGLARLLDGRFAVRRRHTYSRVCCEAVDTLVRAGVDLVTRGRTSSKGVVVTGADLDRHARLFRLYSLVYPLFWSAARLDRALPFAQGYMLIAEARSTKPAAAARATPPAPGGARRPHERSA